MLSPSKRKHALLIPLKYTFFKKTHMPVCFLLLLHNLEVWQPVISRLVSIDFSKKKTCQRFLNVYCTLKYMLQLYAEC